MVRFGGCAAKVAVAGAATASAKLKRKKQVLTDLDAPMPGGVGMAVKIRGKKVTRAELEAEEADEDEEELGQAGSLPHEEEPNIIPVKKLGLVAAQKEKERKAAADPLTRQDGPENPLRVKSPTDRKREAAERSPQDEVRQRLDEASLGKGADDYKLPELDLLLPADDVNFEAQAIEVRRKAKILEKTFLDFGFTGKVVEI